MEKLKKEWKRENAEKRKKGERLFFKEQKKVADDICSLFLTNVIVSLCAPPQWGKTGVSLCVSFKLCMEQKISPDSVYFITGMSDRLWKDQTRERILLSWKQNVFHRNTLHHFGMKVQSKQKKNILIIIDECHLANRATFTLGTIMNQLNIKDPDFMKKNNIKILQISATPTNTLVDATEWGGFQAKISPPIDDGYVSFQNFINEGRIYEPFFLENFEDCIEYFSLIETPNPRYHLIRSVCSGTSGALSYMGTSVNLRRQCEENDIIFIEMNMGKSRQEINKIFNDLSYEPKKHTIILIKNMLGASKTLDDKFIGSVHESTPNEKDYSSEVQGLPGRLCGWTKKKGRDGVMLFCDRSIIEAYIELYQSQFDFESGIVWRDSRLKVNDSGRIRSKESYLSLEH